MDVVDQNLLDVAGIQSAGNEGAFEGGFPVLLPSYGVDEDGHEMGIVFVII